MHINPGEIFTCLDCGAAYRRNADEDLRRMERAAAAGDYQEAARHLAGLVRTGQMTPENASILAFAEDPAAIIAGYQTQDVGDVSLRLLEALEQPEWEEILPWESTIVLLRFLWQLYHLNDRLLFYVLVRLVERAVMVSFRYFDRGQGGRREPRSCRDEIEASLLACNAFSAALLDGTYGALGDDINSPRLTDEAIPACDEYLNYNELDDEINLPLHLTDVRFVIIHMMQALTALSSYHVVDITDPTQIPDIHSRWTEDQDEIRRTGHWPPLALERMFVPGMILVHSAHTILSIRNTFVRFAWLDGRIERTSTTEVRRNNYMQVVEEIIRQARIIIREAVWERV